MGNFVIDSSAIIPYIVTELYTPNVLALFRQVKSEVETLHITDFSKTECVNVLWKQVRFHGMGMSQAEQLIDDLIALPFRIYSTEIFYTEALQIGIKHQLAIYDSIYIALAKQLNYPLITADQKQMQAAAQEHVTVTPLTSFVP